MYSSARTLHKIVDCRPTR